MDVQILRAITGAEVIATDLKPAPAGGRAHRRGLALALAAARRVPPEGGSLTGGETGS